MSLLIRIARLPLIIAVTLISCVSGCGPTEAERLAAIQVQGVEHLDAGETDLAIACFDQVIEESDFADAYVWRGQAYKDKGEWEQALRDYSTALKSKKSKSAGISRMAAPPRAPIPTFGLVRVPIACPIHSQWTPSVL